ncbi:MULTISPECIES: TetR/AcrR family transcriptional regulator [unclassified Paraburkholderia]|uniref:TetR/AcrR family transcriptional regulator n=1 Tax=unclassified Paraburkholderia TaxID=2615204 RepID=UPI00161C18E8|nr:MULTISPECIES: TetR/AcrR family transcriptional regulator [unclassified Paraburkholderia]MBB5443780.1 AcrR family transcriptional regulator [Paraburkholderia sp. WSM4177]MBB5485093.1 AcrR family transcriptional regulator [Paraburkholderia sp. WSM4180]
MPQAPKPRASRGRSLKAPGASRDAINRSYPRGARRKRETRARLLDAALELVAAKGLSSVTINEITEAADVGFGSFYNHFESKEGIFTALIEWLFEEFADTLDRLAAGLSDPAEVIAVSVRHTLLRAYREPVWGQLLIREGLSPRLLSRGLGLRLLRDSEKGISERRFVIADRLVSVISVIGTVLAGIAAELQLAISSKRTVRARKVLRSKEDKFAQRTAAIVLQAFGLTRVEAERIARRPLPTVPDAPSLP